MLEKNKPEESIWRWRWPIIAIAVLMVLFGIQILRVNKPASVPNSASEVRTYTKAGPLVSGQLVIPAADHYSSRIDLNRRAKISGEFKTADLRSRVSVLVMKEADFDNWKTDLEYKNSIVETGYVPGGKISPVLEPGTYFLVIDNRRNNSPQSVRADFALE
jgi:hypothetical protein